MRKNLLIAMLIVMVSVLALEGLIRITSKGPRWLNPYYVNMSSAYPELEALIADAHSPNFKTKYYDEFIYSAAPLITDHVNFTNYYSARWTPDSVPLNEAEYIVWTFGGSTMENTETSDELTIANTWAKVFKNRKGPSHVKNFGTGGFFSSYELIKFQRLLREVPEEELPDIAIFYDGYNDAYFGFQYGPGNMQTDLSKKLQSLVENDNLYMWTYASSRILLKYSKLWERTGARLVDHFLYPLAEPNTDESVLEKTVHVYLSNVNMIQATCDVFHVQCFFVLQPLIVTKHPLSQLEQEVLDNLENHPRFGPEGTHFIRDFYDKVIDELMDNPNFIDSSDILDGRSQPDFYDLGHTSALTSPIIGEKIANLILSRLSYENYLPSD
jgi:hypothetical protein